jgi:transaldolase/glucose-6-phosphate isomerase
MRIALGSDHAGSDLKRTMKVTLLEEHHDIVDVGTDGEDPVDYPDYAEAVAETLREHKAERGIILCGSGVGASMAANRIPGIRAGLCHDTYSAHQGVEHDDMNVLVLGGRVVGVELARELIHAFINARFSGEERHLRRLAKMTALESPLRALQIFGQSVWLDYIRRSLITSGELRRLIDEDGIRGVTSNPSIFEKVVTGSGDYRETIESLAERALDPKTLYETIAIRDIQDAADELRAVYDETAGRDGYVSLEVSPLLAHDTAGTLNEARRLWGTVDRGNLMIKVPATPEGIPAIEELIGSGINVNVTLLFSQDVYEEVANAYIAGLKRLAHEGRDLRHVASVASFFVSRIDTAVDAALSASLLTTTDPVQQSALRALSGKVAIANAKLAYQRYLEIFSGPRWQALAMRGAQTQRLLWASTGTKNPRYRDVMYVEELVGPDTVNTIPVATLDAFRDHGRPRATLLEDVDAAHDTMQALASAGVSIRAITDELLTEGLQLFSEAFDKMLTAVGIQSREPGAERINHLTYSLPGELDAAVREALAEWESHGKSRRLWARDASLWTRKDEAQWLGWLGITNDQLAHIVRLTRIGEIARSSGYTHVVLLGMGGSSLCPEVMRATFGTIEGFPELHVLDSTDPAQVLATCRAVDLARTVFIVSSKSGSTLEPNIFKDYFFDRVERIAGREHAGEQFIAITDPGSAMQQAAERQGFRHTFFGWTNIGGRYSALSDFGLVPAAIMGVDVRKLLERTEAMVHACAPSVPSASNPGVVLGTILGVAAGHFGRDKITIIASPPIAGLGAWLEQLLAESTGKDGKGLIPIDREAPGDPEVYGSDRLFVYLRLRTAADPDQDRHFTALERAGNAMVSIAIDEPYDIGEEFFRWEIATATAGSILGVNPFDQPDVEASKAATRRLTAEYEKTGSLPEEAPIFSDDGISLFADAKNAGALAASLKYGPTTLAKYLEAHLGRLDAGDYFAILAYVEMNAANDQILQAIRQSVRDTTRNATCVEFGPRFLHSTGQAYKGGPNTGVFLQITCDDTTDLAVPGRRYTFGAVKAAQARGDFQVLADRDRRALRVHLASDVPAGLRTLQQAVQAALRL